MADAEEQDLNQPIDTAKTIRSAGWWLLAVAGGCPSEVTTDYLLRYPQT